VFRIVTREKIENYGQLLGFCFGKRIALFVEGLLSLFLLLCLSVMFVAGGSLFQQLGAFPFGWGFGLTAILSGIVLLCGREGVLWLNTVLMPGLIVLSLLIAF